MLRCGYCEKLCDSYEDWLSHLVSDEHQANLGVSDVFTKHNKDLDRNERSILMYHMNPKTRPIEVVSYYAATEPLSFVTDVYMHMFPHINEKFYLIVFDQKKFASRVATLHEKLGDQKVITSMVSCRKKSDLTEDEWNSKLEQSFFFRRHQSLKRKLIEMNWDQQVEGLVKLISLDQKGYEQREAVIDELEALIREVYLEATVKPFGSCTTWLADVNADLDVYVDALGDRGRGDLDKETKLEMMNKVAKVLRDKYDGKNVCHIKTARVPIIKLSHPSGQKIDISFENCLSVQNSKMIRLMAQLDYRLRRLLIFLRYWARFHNLIGPQSVKSYALIMMAFVYLRREKILPSVHELQHIEGVNEFTVCNWNAAYCPSRELTYRHLTWLKGSRDPPSSEGHGHEVLKLAYGFFKEYSSFDFDTQVICPLTGSFLPKAAFESQFGKDLPSEMQLLKANLATSQCTPFKADKPLCVQDPFALNVNVTSSCTNQDTVIQLKAACAMAADALKPFITTYGLAGTESILELCCQPITEVKLVEAILGRSIDMNNLDHLPYVKMEATSSTHEDEWETGNNNQNADQIAKAIIREREGTRYREDYSDRNNSKYDTDSRRRDREREDDGRPLRIIRTSMYDDDRDKDRDRRSSDNFSQGQDRYPRFYDGLGVGESSSIGGESSCRGNTESEEEVKRRSLKSAVVVPGGKGSVKSEATSSLSPSSSSTLTFAKEKSKTDKKKSNGEGSSSREKCKAGKSGKSDKESEKSSNCSSKSSKSASDICQKGKDFKEIQFVIDNKTTPSNEMTKTQSASISSTPVSYNQIVKFVVPKIKVEPVVRFVPTETPPPNTFLPPPPPPPPPVVPIKKEPIVNYEYEEGEEEVEEEGEYEDDVDELEEANELLQNLHQMNQIAPPEETFVRFDNTGSSYGYDRAVQVQGQPVQNQMTRITRTIEHYVPPQARGSVVGQRQPPMSRNIPGQSKTQAPVTPPPPPPQKPNLLLFPAFCLFMNDTYQQGFMNILQNLNVPENVKALKMRVLWINAISDFFADANFWTKFSPLFPESSFQVKKIEEVGAVFERAARGRDDFLQREAQHYALINQNRKRGIDASSTGNSFPQPKILKADPSCQPINPFDYQQMAEVMARLGRIPPNTRKPNAVVYFFACRPEIIEFLGSRWEKLYPSLNPSQSPLEVFGKLCQNIRSTCPIPVIPNSPSEMIIPVKMLVAIDTYGETPGLYFGFETGITQDDPNWQVQQDLNDRFTRILKDLIPAYVNHRLLKYFKSK